MRALYREKREHDISRLKRIGNTIILSKLRIAPNVKGFETMKISTWKNLVYYETVSLKCGLNIFLAVMYLQSLNWARLICQVNCPSATTFFTPSAPAQGS